MEIEYDDDNDGQPDGVRDCWWDKDEHGVSRQRCGFTRIRRASDGTVDGYDIDDDDDGVIDRKERIKEVFDDTGRPVRTDYDGTIDRRKRVHYGSDGEHTMTEYDDDGDGTYERIWPDIQM